MGPKKDIVGAVPQGRAEARPEVRRQRALWISYKWFARQPRRRQDRALAGVPYDGTDPANCDFYHDPHADCPAKMRGTDQGHPRLVEAPLVRPHQGPGRQLPARSALHRRRAAVRGIRPRAWWRTCTTQRHAGIGGKVEAVYTSKRATDCDAGTCVLDFERGVAGRHRAQRRGRPTRASATGTTSAASSTRRPRR